MLGGSCSEGACAGHDDINLERNQFGRESRKPFWFALRCPKLDQDVSALDITEVTQSRRKGAAAVSGKPGSM
jgi:hypothetical protein